MRVTAEDWAQIAKMQRDLEKITAELDEILKRFHLTVPQLRR